MKNSFTKVYGEVYRLMRNDRQCIYRGRYERTRDRVRDREERTENENTTPCQGMGGKTFGMDSLAKWRGVTIEDQRSSRGAVVLGKENTR